MNTAPSESLTFCIPTHNRPEFLQRLLNFFEQTGVRQSIQIIDSSETMAASQNRSVIDAVRSTLNISYAHADLPIVEKCCDVLSRVETPFVAFCADDDFQFPDLVDECVEFLEANHDYTTAQGRVIHVSNVVSHRDNVYRCSLGEARDIDQHDAAERFEAMASHTHSTFYGIHRTTSLLRAFEITRDHTDYQAARVFMESLLLGLSALAGKIKVLPGVQYIQQTHGTNDAVLIPRIVDRDQAQELYQRYRAALVTEIMAMSNKPKHEAEMLVEQCSGLVPGMAKRRRTSTGWPQKMFREVTRTTVFLARLIKKTGILQSSKGKTAVLHDTNLMPDTAHYHLAVRLIKDFPTGIPMGKGISV